MLEKLREIANAIFFYFVIWLIFCVLEKNQFLKWDFLEPLDAVISVANMEVEVWRLIYIFSLHEY